MAKSQVSIKWALTLGAKLLRLIHKANYPAMVVIDHLSALVQNGMVSSFSVDPP